MSSVVHLKFGEKPSIDRYLIVTRQGRIRGEDFYVQPSEPLQLGMADAHAAFASLASALREAECVAQRHGVETIYVRLA